MIYVTTINQMYTVPNPPEYVVNVLFTVSGIEGEYTAQISGNIWFTPEPGQTIIPYEQLTETEVIGWINAATNNQENYYLNINGQIESQINPPVVPEAQPLPWTN